MAFTYGTRGTNINTTAALQEAYDARMDRLQDQAALEKAAEEENRLRRMSAQWGCVCCFWSVSGRRENRVKMCCSCVCMHVTAAAAAAAAAAVTVVAASAVPSCFRKDRTAVGLRGVRLARVRSLSLSLPPDLI